MATYYGSNAAMRDTAVPSKKMAATDQHGRIRVAYDEFSLPSALALNDVIKLSKLPAGARLLGVVMSNDALTAGAVNVGWEANGIDAASANGIFAAQSVASAATTTLTATANSAALFKIFQAETQISAVVSTAITGTSGKIRVCLHYSLD